MNKTETPDYYQALQVHPSAEPEIIQAAYRRLSLKYHPDVNKSKASEARMRELNAAYEVLRDPQKRAAYDRARTPIGTHRKASPVLSVDTEEMDLGEVVIGRAKTGGIHLCNGGGGILSGFLVSHVPWLKVSPPDFEGNDLDVVLRFEASRPGQYLSPKALEVYSNGGKAVVSVRATVTPFRKGISNTFTKKEEVPFAPTAPENVRATFRRPSSSRLMVPIVLTMALLWSAVTQSYWLSIPILLALMVTLFPVR